MQNIQARIRKFETPIPELGILSIKTPRTERLRFLAGQQVRLEIPGVGNCVTHVASCPCDDMNLQFHIARNDNSAFADYAFERVKPNDIINIEGPSGHFVLREDEISPIVFIAFGDGFAPIKSLIEHAMTLDVTEHISLFWVVNDKRELYLHNHCRAWADAFERFSYTPLISAAEDPARVDELMKSLRTSVAQAADSHYYIAGPGDLVNRTRDELMKLGIDAACIFSEARE